MKGVVWAEFCTLCGAGIGKYRRLGEAACPICTEQHNALVAEAREIVKAADALAQHGEPVP